VVCVDAWVTRSVDAHLIVLGEWLGYVFLL